MKFNCHHLHHQMPIKTRFCCGVNHSFSGIEVAYREEVIRQVHREANNKVYEAVVVTYRTRLINALFDQTRKPNL